MSAHSTTPGAVLMLDRATIASLVSKDDCIAAVESAFAAHAGGYSLAPEMMHVDARGGEFHIKAGGLCNISGKDSCYFTCKINGGFFGNYSKLGLPNIIGLIQLSDGTNGAPLAVMDSGRITAHRTGAATAVAAKYLARPESKTVTLCGAGSQGEIQLNYLMRCLPIERVYVWSRTNCEGFAKRMSRELQIDVQAAANLEAATGDSDVIVTCTSATDWFLGLRHVGPGTFVAAVGADSPAKQELEPALIAQSEVVCDLVAQCAQVGELHHAIAAGLTTSAQIRGELSGVIAGHSPGRLSADETIIFDSTGVALQDTAVAVLAYERARAMGRGTSFAFC